MVRRNLTMTPRHSERLEEEARKQQVSMSEVLRKALDMYFARKEK